MIFDLTLTGNSLKPIINDKIDLKKIRKEFSRALGYRVALVARRLKDLDAIAQEINQSGGEVGHFQLTVSSKGYLL
jgi:hypothetical protein